jgi:leucyl/phenylalanyl-tRNA--protein transferase
MERTWITEDIISAYTELHRLGWAHSAEAWQGGVLGGGCYGIRIGKVYIGESMCSLVPNASKAALLSLARIMFDDDLALVDCQVPTEHLESLGGAALSRGDYLWLLKQNIKEHFGPDRDEADRRGNWALRYK